MIRKGFGIRLGAILIDGVILFVLRWILLIPFAPKINVTSATSLEEIVNQAVKYAARAALIMGVIGIAYSLMEVFQAATPGKMALKLKITNADGTPAPRDRLVKRWAIKNCYLFAQLLFGITGIMLFNWIGTLAALFVLVSCLMALRDTRLALHDDLAGTAVFGPGVEQPAFPVMPVTTGAAVPPPPPTGAVPPPPPAV